MFFNQIKLQTYFLIIASQLLIVAKVYLITYSTFFKNFKKGLIEVCEIEGYVHVSKSYVHVSKGYVCVSAAK